MKRLLLLACLLPTLAFSQTTTKKVLQMAVTRTTGTSSVKTYLLPDSSFVGPIFNLHSDTLTITNTKGTTLHIARKRLKEIRFTVETIEVPTSIEQVKPEETQDKLIYDMSGRAHKADEQLKHGIYIIGNKKVIK